MKLIKRFRKISLYFIVFIFICTFLVGCNSKLDNKVTLLKEINISSIKDNNFFSTTPEKKLLNNVFLIEDSSDQYIVFYKMNIENESISCSVKNSVLEVNIKTSSNTENTYAYKIIHPKEKNFEAIKLIKDGEHIVFSSVIMVN